MNYFELFNFPAAFELDTQALAGRYRELASAVHPDKFAGGSEQEKLLAVSRTAMINDAFQTLKDPVRRAEHLLVLKGVDIRHEIQTVRDTAFLMQQMEWREALEDIGHSDDPGREIDALRDSFRDYSAGVTETLKRLLASSVADDWHLAADQLRKLKFMNKLQAELERAEDALFE
ncbi:co-chaperone HscB [Shewanella cyperi]|uniref:Co-chaperone protein HscB homolog n=1 Tax=Shewanella cyperi TaxID=2814292 RepID=A0A974XMU7_9GAMM|nr:co-chaperone HscB [Shewanella cyperi]QSX31296.1 co-chaperone HscB [Shewanella cyperi]